MNVQDFSYLIIGGAPKAGTTSLFHWLNDHPDVNGAIFKEARFFLDDDYPLESPVRYNGHNLDDYLKCFAAVDDKAQLLVEATPDYLYSKIALTISKLLPKAKMIFILRDPVGRAVSWYKYALQRGLIDSTMSFEEYVLAQVGETVVSSTPVHMRALDQNRYDHYLRGFKERFKDNIMLVDFEVLKDKPEKVMSDLCIFVGLDAGFYRYYNYKIKNISTVANKCISADKAYRFLRRRIVYALYRFPLLIKCLSYPNHLLKKFFLSEIEPAKDVLVSKEIENIIRQHAKRGMHG